MEQYTHFHPVYGKLKFIRMSVILGLAYFELKNGANTCFHISEVEIYKPNNLTNYPIYSPIPCYSGS